MKLVANMRINYWLFNLSKISSKIRESSDRNTLNMKIVNAGKLTYSKMLTWSKRTQVVNIKRRISHMDPVQKYHWKALCYQFQPIYDAENQKLLVGWMIVQNFHQQVQAVLQGHQILNAQMKWQIRCLSGLHHWKIKLKILQELLIQNLIFYCKNFNDKWFWQKIPTILRDHVRP